MIQELNLSVPIVLATGGGSLLRSVNGKKLKEKSFLIYLKTPPEILKERIWQRSPLPSYLSELSGQPESFVFNRMVQERLPIYEFWADITVEMDQLDPNEALMTLLNIVQGDGI